MKSSSTTNSSSSKPSTPRRSTCLTFYVPIFEPLPPQYFVRVTSDRWLGRSTHAHISWSRMCLHYLDLHSCCTRSSPVVCHRIHFRSRSLSLSFFLSVPFHLYQVLRSLKISCQFSFSQPRRQPWRCHSVTSSFLRSTRLRPIFLTCKPCPSLLSATRLTSSSTRTILKSSTPSRHKVTCRVPRFYFMHARRRLCD